MSTIDTYIAQALEEFVTDTQNLLTAAEQQKPLDKDEIGYWTRQRNAFAKAQKYFADGTRLAATPSAYLVPSASRPGALVHRLYQAGDVWICPCEARGFCWHHALVHGYERGAELASLDAAPAVPAWMAEEDAALLTLLAA